MWRLVKESDNGKLGNPNGRFVVYEQADGDGPRLDLRLESGGVLARWRLRSWDDMQGDLLKMQLANCQAMDSGELKVGDQGEYGYLEKTTGRGRLVFRGGRLNGTYRLEEVEAEKDETERAESDEREGLKILKEATGVARLTLRAARALAVLVEDGRWARREAIESLCAMGQDLDGEQFPRDSWRRSLRNLSLAEIHEHLRSFETRFDEKYPPASVTKREELRSEKEGERTNRAAEILREVG